MGVFVSKLLAGNEELPVSVEGQEGHHVVSAVVPDRSVRLWILGRRRPVPPEPLLINAFHGKQTKEMNCACVESQSFVCLCTGPLSYLSTKAWWRRNMGSFAEPCTDDMDPFMNTWTAACMYLRELLPNPVRGSPNPAGGEDQKPFIKETPQVPLSYFMPWTTTKLT